MTFKRLSLIAIFATVALSAVCQSNMRFSFNKDGKFRIAQFTDIHWCDDSIAKCTRTLESIQAVIDAEHPDLIVLSGDVVTDHPAVKGWQSIINFFGKQSAPYIVEMGNHDAEFIAKDTLYSMLTSSPKYAGIIGNHVSGYGNMSLPIYASHGSNAVKNVIYLIDSNDYPSNLLHGKYDWIHFDQIEWYRRESDRFTAVNGGKPVPSLAYFHIPLEEFKHVIKNPDTYGKSREGVAAAGVNSGFFASVLEKNDIVGIFCGHDHVNDYIGIHAGVALGYGRNSGWNAYGNFERGGRIVELQEGSRHFDSWITTAKGREAVYHYPSGITSIEEEGEYLKAKNVSPKKNGVAYSYYEGNIQSCAEIKNLKPQSKGTFSNFFVDSEADKDHFAYDFRALFKAPEKAVYKFRLRSDDGAQLFIDGRLIIDNDGSHSANFVVGKVALEAGYHDIQILYFEDYMGQELTLKYQTPNIDESLVSDDMLFLPSEK